MLVLNTSSPKTVFAAPKEKPSKTLPSERISLEAKDSEFKALENNSYFNNIINLPRRNQLFPVDLFFIGIIRINNNLSTAVIKIVRVK